MSDNENDGVFDLLKRRGLSVDRLQRMHADKVVYVSYRIVPSELCAQARRPVLLVLAPTLSRGAPRLRVLGAVVGLVVVFTAVHRGEPLPGR